MASGVVSPTEVEMNREKDQELARRLAEACPGRVRPGEPMARHTTVGVGGPARFFAEPGTPREVAALVRAALDFGIEYTAVGKGSNLLVRDGGYPGLIIAIGQGLSRFTLYKRTAHAEAGMSFTHLGKVLTREGRPGFEFAVGIPGSVGGAIRMNAGAWGCSVAGVLESVRIVDGTGRVAVLQAGDLGLVYRGSSLPRGSIILSAVFNCPPGDIDRAMLERSRTRDLTQPLSEKSFGSTFKNPAGDYAGRLIEACGLKGTRRGGVEVSRKHANFLVNVGEDTKARDIEELMVWIVERVEAKFKVTLLSEVIIIGDR